MSDPIDRQAAIDALWKAMYEYEDKMEKQFIESDDLDIEEWILHRIFVQNMNDIDRKVILNLPSTESKRKTGKWIMHSDFPDRLICSKCGATFDAWHWEAEQMHFCPQCGFKMGGERRTDDN